MPLRLAITHCGHADVGSGTTCFSSRTTVHASRPLAASPYSKHAGNTHLPPPAVSFAAPACPGTKRCCVRRRDGAAVQSSTTSSSGTPGRLREAAKGGHDRVVAGGERGEEVFGGRIAPGMLRHIAANAFAERIGPQPLLEHREHRLALGVGDAVERGADVGVLRHRLAQLARGREAVELDRLRALERAPCARPLRAQLENEARREPGGERLVEPKVVPPGHRHVVAEPHVRDLVRGDAHEALLERRMRPRRAAPAGCATL